MPLQLKQNEKKFKFEKVCASQNGKENKVEAASLGHLFTYKKIVKHKIQIVYKIFHKKIKFLS